MSDAVNHPKHYTSDPSGVECITITRHRTFNIGNAIKYLWRAGLKDQKTTVEDLNKAIWYITDEINRLTLVNAEVIPQRTQTSVLEKVTPGVVDWWHNVPVDTIVQIRARENDIKILCPMCGLDRWQYNGAFIRCSNTRCTEKTTKNNLKDYRPTVVS